MTPVVLVRRLGDGGGGGQDLAVGRNHAEIGITGVTGEEVIEEAFALTAVPIADCGGLGQREKKLAGSAEDFFFLANSYFGEFLGLLAPTRHLAAPVFPGGVQHKQNERGA